MLIHDRRSKKKDRRKIDSTAILHHTPAVGVWDGVGISGQEWLVHNTVYIFVEKQNAKKKMRNTRHKNTNDPQKKYHLGTVSKNILLEGLNRFHGASLTLSSDVDQDT